MTNVYGPSDHALIDLFLRDLHDVAATINDPWLLIGDFDLTRSPNDKNSMTFNANLASRFNQAVDALQLVKLPLLDGMFTWTNKRAEPTLSRLDRAFFNLSFGEIFPATSLTSGCRPTSDHNPIIASIQTNIPKPNAFGLELSWLLDHSFLPSVIPAWQAVTRWGDAARVLVAQAIQLGRH